MGRGNKDANQINGLIDRGCSVEGKLMFDGAVQITPDIEKAFKFHLEADAEAMTNHPPPGSHWNNGEVVPVRQVSYWEAIG